MAVAFPSNFPPKTVGERLFYDGEWAQAVANGGGIASYGVEVDPALTVDTIEMNGTIMTFWLSGGTPGLVHDVIPWVMTGNGSRHEAEMRISITSSKIGE
jgi:hypothetical protein